MDNILSLHRDLIQEKYKHGGYKEFVIHDPKQRLIHKASVRDRLVHHAVFRVLFPFFNRTFMADSFSSREGKGTHRAIKRFQKFAGKVSENNTRTCWVLKCDIQKFFASIDHEILINLLGESISDQKTLNLLKEIIRSHCSSKNLGLPLGNLTSQLFVNIYLNELDQFLKHRLREKYYLRYADDLMILSEDKDHLGWLVIEIRQFLDETLKLTLHPNKTTICTLASGIDFLGYVVFPNHVTLRTRAKRRMFGGVCEKNLPSYLGLLSHCEGYELQKVINEIVENQKQ